MELVVTTALLVLVLAVVLSFVPQGGQSWNQNAARSEGQQHARIAMEELVHELLYAYRLEVNPAGRTLTYYKKKNGYLRRYRVYILAQQLLLDLPEGTSVPLASGIEGFVLAPAGELRAGDVLKMTLRVRAQEQSVQVRCAVVAKNLATGGS